MPATQTTTLYEVFSPTHGPLEVKLAMCGGFIAVMGAIDSNGVDVWPDMSDDARGELVGMIVRPYGG